MKKKRAFAALLAAALCLGLLAGCGGTQNNTPTPGGASAQPTPSGVAPSTNLNNPPQPDQILSDVGAFRYTVLPEGTTVTDCEVIKRQSNPENKEDIVYCRLTGPEDGYKYAQYYVRLLYNFYDEGGWILDEMTADQVDQWGTIGYLDSEGRPIEEGLVLIGPAAGIGNSNSSGGSPAGDIPDGPDATPRPAGIDRPSARSYPTAINNEGMWDYQGKVYDFFGNEVSGLVQNTIANRAIWWENRQLYLCDLNGNKLSAGYDSIRYGGRVLDNNGTVVDHRWQVQRGDKLGFLNDAGEDVIPLIYNDSDYAYPMFCAETSGGGSAYKVCVFHDDAADTNIVVAVDGRELLRTSDSVSVYGNGFYTNRYLTDGSGGHYCKVYTADGTQLLSGTYYQIDANDAGFCGWVGFDQNHAWDLCTWDGSWSRELWDGEEHLSLLYMLPNSYCYGDYDNSRCVMRCSGATITANQIVTYTNSWINYSAYGALNCSTYVMDMDGNGIFPPAGLEEEVHYNAVAGGIYEARGIYSGTTALFDWKGNQRTEYFDGIVARSENGRYFIVVKDGQYYAMKSPIGEEELQTAPALNFCRIG